MESLDRQHRVGVDTQTALLSQLRRATADRDAADRQATVQNGKPGAGSLRGTVKMSLRSAARGLLRGSKPVVLPVASRVRWYLIAPLLDELQRTQAQTRELQRTHSEILSELQKLQPRLDRIEHFGHATARRVAVAYAPPEALVRTEAGYVVCSAADRELLACLIETGQLAQGSDRLIQRLVGPGDVFVDVGAHLGLHTLAAARAMNGEGRVVAIEPFEPTRRLLEKSVQMNGFAGIVEIDQAAASHHSGRQRLFLGTDSAHHSLFPPDVPAEGDDPTVEVPLVRLDDVMSASPTVDLIKIAAEGAELEVLDGARSLIEHNQEIALIVEFDSARVRRAGVSSTDWLAQFEGLGFMYQVICTRSGCLEDWSIAQLDEAGAVDVLFARPYARAWRRAQPGTQASPPDL